MEQNSHGTNSNKNNSDMEYLRSADTFHAGGKDLKIVNSKYYQNF